MIRRRSEYLTYWFLQLEHQDPPFTVRGHRETYTGYDDSDYRAGNYFFDKEDAEKFKVLLAKLLKLRVNVTDEKILYRFNELIKEIKKEEHIR